MTSNIVLHTDIDLEIWIFFLLANQMRIFFSFWQCNFFFTECMRLFEIPTLLGRDLVENGIEINKEV